MTCKYVVLRETSLVKNHVWVTRIERDGQRNFRDQTRHDFLYKLNLLSIVSNIMASTYVYQVTSFIQDSNGKYGNDEMRRTHGTYASANDANSKASNLTTEAYRFTAA